MHHFVGIFLWYFCNFCALGGSLWQFRVNSCVCIQTLFSPEPPDLHLPFFSHFNFQQLCFTFSIIILFEVPLRFVASILIHPSKISLSVCLFVQFIQPLVPALLVSSYLHILILAIYCLWPKGKPFNVQSSSCCCVFVHTLPFCPLRTWEGQMCGVRVFHWTRDRDHNWKHSQHTQWVTLLWIIINVFQGGMYLLICSDSYVF